MMPTKLNACGKHLAEAVVRLGSRTSPVQVRPLDGRDIAHCQLENRNGGGKPCTSWAWYEITARGEPSCDYCGSTDALTGINTTWACPKHISIALHETLEPVRDFLDGETA